MADQYAEVERKLELVPQDCLGEVSSFIDFVIYRNGQKKETAIPADDRKTAAMQLAGIWKDRDDNDVDTMVRNMRKGRRFDI